MRRSLNQRATNATEDRRFRELFGCGPRVALIVWRRLVRQDLIPYKERLVHLLWALMHLKIYGKEAEMCSLAGGVSEKTFRKWTWPFVSAIADLEPYVVSSFCLLFLFLFHVHLTFHFSFFQLQIKWIQRFIGDT